MILYFVRYQFIFISFMGERIRCFIRIVINYLVKRPIIINQCRADDFAITNGRYLLKWENNPRYVSFLMKPILQYKTEIFLYIQGYYRAFMKGKKVVDFPVFL